MECASGGGAQVTHQKLPAFGPSEDLLLRVFREYFYGDPYRFDPPWNDKHKPYIHTLLPDDMRFPLVFIRRDRRSGSQNLDFSDQRHAISAVATVETFMQGDDADVDSALLQEAVRQCLFTAVNEQKGWPDLGYLSAVNLWSQPARVSDYATSTGVVQYASLPNGVIRYESIYQFILRPAKGAVVNPFVPSP